MPKMYYCWECKRKHRYGKIYKDHLKYKQNNNKNPERDRLLLKLAKINRMIIYGNYDKNGVNFLIGLKIKIEEKLK